MYVPWHAPMAIEVVNAMLHVESSLKGTINTRRPVTTPSLLYSHWTRRSSSSNSISVQELSVAVIILYSVP
jgi:hypothetical protein